MNKEIKVLHELLCVIDGLYQHNEELAEKFDDIIFEYVMSKDIEYKRAFNEYELQV